MIRHCDGNDVNLVRPIPAGNGYIPCDCGLKFDDVDLSVVFPHVPVAVKSLADIRAAVELMQDGEAKGELLRDLAALEDAQDTPGGAQ